MGVRGIRGRRERRQQGMWLALSFLPLTQLGVDVAVDVAGIIVVPTVDEVGRRRGR